MSLKLLGQHLLGSHPHTPFPPILSPAMMMISTTILTHQNHGHVPKHLHSHLSTLSSFPPPDATGGLPSKPYPSIGCHQNLLSLFPLPIVLKSNTPVKTPPWVPVLLSLLFSQASRAISPTQSNHLAGFNPPYSTGQFHSMSIVSVLYPQIIGVGP